MRRRVFSVLEPGPRAGLFCVLILVALLLVPLARGDDWPFPSWWTPGMIEGAPAAAAAPVNFRGDFGSCDLSQWPYPQYSAYIAEGKTTVWNVAGGCSGRLRVDNQTNASAMGDAVMLWEDAQNPYENPKPWLTNGADTWFRMRILFPSGANAAYPGRFTPAPVGWIDPVYGPQSGWDVIEAWHTAPGAGYDNIVNLNPATGRLELRLVGGPVAAQIWRYLPGPPLAFDRWLDIVVHLRLSVTAGFGEWFVDGVPYGALATPTMTVRTDGTVPPVGHSVGLYRSSKTRTDTDTVYLDDVLVGPTRASVGG